MITILIVWEAIERFRTPRPVEGGMMMAIAVAGLLANILSFWLLHHGSEEKTSTCEQRHCMCSGTCWFGWGYYCRVDYYLDRLDTC